MLSIVLSLIAFWMFVVIYNILFFVNAPSSPFDSFFISKKSFADALKDVELLNKIKGKRFVKIKDKIEFYYQNARITRRKYSYYREKIEPVLHKIYFENNAGFKYCFSRLDLPLKIFFILIVSFFIFGIFALLTFLIHSFAENKNGWVILFTIVFIAFLIKFYNFLFRANYLILYGVVELFLYLTKSDRGRFNKNYAILDLLTDSLWGTNNYGGIVLSSGGTSSFSGGSSGGGFGGFGGGSFGGGGAGGSW